MPKRKRRTDATGALAVVRRARTAARQALDSLREEIRSLQGRLEKLLTEERSFREELFGAVRSAMGGRPTTAARPTRRRRPARPKGPPKAERYYQKLPGRFTLDDVRKLAGRAAGVSIAQWTRAKRVRKTASGYQKT